MAPLIPLLPRRDCDACLSHSVGVGPGAELMGPCLGLDGAISQSLVLARGLWLWAPSATPQPFI